jgi:hypothetical protein
MYERVWTGIHVVRTVATIFPYMNLERKSKADQSLGVVRTEIHVVRTDDAWSVGVQTVWHIVRTDGIMDR